MKDDASNSPAKREKISKDTALQHVLLAVRREWASGMPDFQEWGTATVDESPLVIQDLNGLNLFYDFNVVKKGEVLGVVRASANKLVGSPIISLQLGPHKWSLDSAKKEAARSLKDSGIRTDTKKAAVVCYSYPKLGMHFGGEGLEGGNEAALVDIGDFSIVDRFGADEAEGMTSYSFLEETAIPQMNLRMRKWEAAEEELEGIKKSSPKILEGTLKEKDANTLVAKAIRNPTLMTPNITRLALYSSKVIRYAPRCTPHDCFELRAQQTNVYCAVATGQMILDFYRYYFSQDDIAAAMGTGSGGTSNTGQVTGYESLSNGGLDATYDSSAAWSEAKAEIDANRPLKSGIPGHARACAGWKRQNFTLIGTPPKKWLKIYDPWPWNANICDGGAVYWEDWDAVTHTNFIYVRHT